MPVAECDQREPCAALRACVDHRLLDRRPRRESTATKGRREREREQGDQGEAGIERRPGGHADDDDRLAQRDDDHEAVPLDEVLRRDDEAFGAREPGREPEESAASPRACPALARPCPADEHEHRGGEVERHDPKNRRRPRRRRCLFAYMPACRTTTTRIRSRTRALRPRRHRAPRVRSRGSRPFRRAGGAEAKEVGRDRVRQPRVSVVHPPDHREHHDDLHGAAAAPPPSTSTLVSWVIVKTKTRSKKSSSVETRALRSMSSDTANHLRAAGGRPHARGRTQRFMHAGAKRTPSGISAARTPRERCSSLRIISGERR